MTIASFLRRTGRCKRKVYCRYPSHCSYPRNRQTLFSPAWPNLRGVLSPPQAASQAWTAYFVAFAIGVFVGDSHAIGSDASRACCADCSSMRRHVVPLLLSKGSTNYALAGRCRYRGVGRLGCHEDGAQGPVSWRELTKISRWPAWYSPPAPQSGFSLVQRWCRPSATEA